MSARSIATPLFAAAAVLGALSASPAAMTQAREGRVHISVTKDGQAVPIAPADVTITEDGRPREVLKVEKASGPVSIALLVDDSQAARGAINDLRAALKQFTAKMLAANPDSQIALITYGERPTLLTDYTNNPGQLERGINRIFTREGAGAYLLEAIISASRGIAKREAERAHIVIIGTEGVEFSNDHYDRVLDHLAESGATLWALTLTAGPRADDTEEVRNRAVVLGRGPARTGGRQDIVLANSATTVVLERIGDAILNQYVVVYGRPDVLVPPKKISVKVAKPGTKLLAPENAPRVKKQ